MKVLAEPFYVGGYWGNRRESVDVCADRLEAFLRQLADAHPLLGSWLLTGDDSTSAKAHPFESTSESLRELLLAGRPRRDSDGSVMEDLGFLASLWNGHDTAAVGLMVRCGASPATATVGNAVVLDLPEAEGAALGLYSQDTARLVMNAVVSCWEPAWTTWTSDRLRRAQHAKPREIVVGWKTYLASPQPLPIERLPANVATDAIGEGILLTIGSDPNAVSEAAVIAVRDSLGDALRPTG